MHLLSRILSAVFDVLLLPFGTHRLAALLVVSLVSGVAFALLFRAASNQRAIRRARDLFKARVLEMRIYPNDLVLILRALFGALASQFTYLRVALKPVVLVLLVAMPVFVQMESRFSRAPLHAGQRTLVTAELKEGLEVHDVPAVLTGTGGLHVEAPPLRVPATREIVWRASLAPPDNPALALTLYDRPYQCPIVASPGTGLIGNTRAAHGVLDPLIHPGLPPVPPDSPLASIRITYPSDSYHLFGHRMSWLAIFLIGSFVGALLPAWILRIQF